MMDQNKYFLIAGIALSLGLIYYFWSRNPQNEPIKSKSIFDDVSKKFDEIFGKPKKPINPNSDIIPNVPGTGISGLSVLSFNMASNVLRNNIAGSEMKFVLRCKDAYPKYDGWSDSTKTISACSLNAAKLICNYDLFGLQEVPYAPSKGLYKTIQALNPSRKFKFVPSNTLTIGYDENVMGKGVPLTHRMKMGSRVIQAVWFPKMSILFVNLHAEHNVNLIQLIENACARIPNPGLKVPSYRVLMTGDFNDRRGQLLRETLNVFGKNLRIPKKSIAPKSCCYGSKFSKVGDYVLDSDYDKGQKYFGLPQNLDRSILMSDHLPVNLIEV
jgi:hypothetical protein